MRPAQAAQLAYLVANLCVGDDHLAALLKFSDQVGDFRIGVGFLVLLEQCLNRTAQSGNLTWPGGTSFL